MPLIPAWAFEACSRVNFNKFSQLGIWFHFVLVFYAASTQEKEIVTCAPIMPITIAEDSDITECESGFLASMLPLWCVFLWAFSLHSVYR